MKETKFLYTARILSYKWNKSKNKIEASYIKVEKLWTESDIVKCKKDYVRAILVMAFILGCLGCIGFAFNWIVGLCSVLALIGISLLIGFINYNHFISHDYTYDLGDEDKDFHEFRLNNIFAEEIERENKFRAKEEAKAKRWRNKHPLEELIRISLESKNPNEIANLIRYCIDVKGELAPPPPEEDKDKIIVRYLST